MIRKFNVGIIGTGNIASVMAQTISKMKGVKLYAVASRQKVRAEVFAGKYGWLYLCHRAAAGWQIAGELQHSRSGLHAPKGRSGHLHRG